jgi:hypothetical protein
MAGTTVADPAPAPADAALASPEEGAAVTGPRLQEFESEIRRLRVRGGSAEPERRLVVLAAVSCLVVAFVGLSGARSAETAVEQRDGVAQTIVGVGVAVVGVVIWARYSLSRYLRY